MVMSVRITLLPLIFLFMIRGVFSDDDWEVEYKRSHICALKNSSVKMSCTYEYPTGYQIKNVFWTKGAVKKGVEPPDLSEDPEYSQRLQYLGDKQQICTMRLNHVTLKDNDKYYFRFITNKPNKKNIGNPGVTLSVTDLQVESPERVTEGDSVRLTCKSSCTLTDRATFIWYRNSQPLTERRDRNNELLLQSVRREDAGRYSCAVHGHNHISPDVQLNVMSGFVSGHSTNLSAAIVIAALCAVLFLACIIIFIRKRKCAGVSDVKQKQVQQASSSDRNHSDDGLYARVSPRRTRTDLTAGKTESTDSQISYATVQHPRNNEDKYENLRMDHPDPAARSGAAKVIYSTVK